MQIPIEQVWEYEFKPTDTMRLLHAFKNVWENQGDEITLERRGGKIFAVRREKDEEEDLLSKVFGRDPLDGFPSIRKEN
jgi:hypothetical protein